MVALRLFTRSQTTMQNENAISLESPSGRLESCMFCDVSTETGFKIAHEDGYFVAFEDRKPASVHHYLVTPKRHVESVRSLNGKEDADLLRGMEKIGHTILNKLDVPEDMRRMGFHIPPLNSVNHLHLHVQCLPYLSSRRAAKYPIVPGPGSHSKGLSWFVEVNQAIRILEGGNRVGLLPC